MQKSWLGSDDRWFANTIVLSVFVFLGLCFWVCVCVCLCLFVCVCERGRKLDLLERPGMITDCLPLQRLLWTRLQHVWYIYYYKYKY